MSLQDIEHTNAVDRASPLGSSDGIRRPLRVCLISGMAMADTHGTGVQLRRIFENSGIEFAHLYWNARYSGRSVIHSSYQIEDGRWWPWLRGRRTAVRLQQKLGLSWWDRSGIRIDHFRRLVSRIGLNPDVAYVTVASDVEAGMAQSLVDYFGCPYIVHLWDNAHPQGLLPDLYPKFARLLRSAAAVLALSDPLADEARRAGAQNIAMVGFAQNSDVPQAAWDGRSPLRIAMSGTLYEPGLRLLQRAAEPLKQAFPGVQIIYTGRYSKLLSNYPSDIIRDHGFVPDAARYLQLLASCQLAYLPGPSNNDAFSRYSIPSRIADFFMSSLPLLANVPPGSASARFLEKLEGTCVSWTTDESKLVDSVRQLAGSLEKWQNASRAARAFALRELSVEGVRAQVFGALRDAVAGRTPAAVPQT